MRSSIAMMEDASESDSWKDAFAFSRRYPRFGIPYLRAKWLSTKAAPRVKELAENNSFTSFAKLFLFHPLFTIRHVLPKIQISRGGTEQHEQEKPDTSRDAGPQISMTEVGSVSDDADPLQSIAEAENIYLGRQVVSAATRRIDANLFSGPDRDNDGFVRLMLRESYHDFVLPGSDERHHVVFEPRLLLHETGVAQIDLVLSAETSLDVRQVLAMMWGPEPIFVRSEVSVPLIRGTLWESTADFSEGLVDAGQRLGFIEHSEPVSMQDLLHLHLFAVLKIIKRSYKYWSSYPVAIVGPNPCCGPEDWQQTHQEDLIRLTIRSSHDSELAKHVTPPADLSLSRNHSLFARLGSAIYLQWSGSPPKGITELDTALVLEYSQLLYVRLQSLEEDVSRIVSGERRLRARYRAAARLFSELRQRDLRSGEARDIVRNVLDEFGASETRKTIETALSLSASSYSARSAERAAGRAWWITLTATLIGLVVALPQIGLLLASVPAREPSESWPLIPLRWLAGQGFWGSWITLASVVTPLITIWVLGRFWRWRIRRLPSFRRGYKWPTEFTFSDDEFSPAAVNQRSIELAIDISGELDRR
ncbi:hypothetical protein [Arthrobacter sp. HY1533]|uniref:hypothetical protein n=1 Tax=Arthrobacter sp. HY1533 TaxID=2970919 RepID=UPI0022B9E2F7|nr:hypothetical protein [Arthrobacter sp. HY1533]